MLAFDKHITLPTISKRSDSRFFSPCLFSHTEIFLIYFHNIEWNKVREAKNQIKKSRISLKKYRQRQCPSAIAHKIYEHADVVAIWQTYHDRENQNREAGSFLPWSNKMYRKMWERRMKKIIQTSNVFKMRSRNHIKFVKQMDFFRMVELTTTQSVGCWRNWEQWMLSMIYVFRFNLIVSLGTCS